MDRWESIGVMAALTLLVAGILLILLLPWLPRSVTTGLQTVGDALPLSFVLTGLLVLFVSLGLWLSSDRVTDAPDRRFIPEGTPPERPQSPPARPGEAFENAVESAVINVRIKGVDPSETEPREELRSVVRSVLAQQPEVSGDEAQAMIETGEWTTDRVAQGFFSDDVTYPLAFRVLRWARPGLAYERAATRSIDAVGELATTRIPGYTHAPRQLTTEGSSTTSSTAVQRLISTGRDLLGQEKSEKPGNAVTETAVHADGGRQKDRLTRTERRESQDSKSSGVHENE